MMSDARRHSRNQAAGDYSVAGARDPDKAGICLDLIKAAPEDMLDIRRLPRPSICWPNLWRRDCAG